MNAVLIKGGKNPLLWQMISTNQLELTLWCLSSLIIMSYDIHTSSIHWFYIPCVSYSTGRNKVAIDHAKPRISVRGNKYRALPRAGFSTSLQLFHRPNSRSDFKARARVSTPRVLRGEQFLILSRLLNYCVKSINFVNKVDLFLSLL